MYSVTFAFGNVGEALAIVVMVIQVAGSGGTFPIEALPQVFQWIYPFLPFQFGMKAFKECIAGMYGVDYWINDTVPDRSIAAGTGTGAAVPQAESYDREE